MRFAAAVEDQNDGVLFTIPVKFAEIAPIRALPEFDEATTAAGTAPALWYDANREFYLSHIGTIRTEASVYDAAFQTFPAPWQAGSLNLGGTTAQYQTYHFSGVEWAKTAANITALVGTQPAATIFLIAKHSAPAAKQVLFAIGATSATNALGIQLDASGNYSPWLGASETWTAAKSANSPVDTYRSLAVTWAASSNNATLYINAASIGTDSNTRSLTAGPASLGASPTGTLLCNAAAGMANCKVAHVLVFPAALTLAQIKAVHNLLGYQYGLSIVS